MYYNGDGNYNPEERPEGAPEFTAEPACTGESGESGESGTAVPKRKKKRPFVKAAALFLAVVLLGSASGIGAASLWMGQDNGSTGDVIDLGGSVPAINVVKSGSDSVLTGNQIYTLGCEQVVAISVNITGTNAFRQTVSYSVSGSGFIISEDGYVITNYHVVESAATGSSDIVVLLHSGKTYKAEYIGGDKDNDVALLKIDEKGLNPVALGDSDAISVGQNVYAIGNPLGELAYSMTSGIVSALDREITTDSSSAAINMFQIDAAVNSGNSGGPVYNDRGEVIGIVTAKSSESGVEGIGFAVPINDAVSIVQDLLEYGSVRKAYLNINGKTASEVEGTTVDGLYIANLAEGSCAVKAGLEPGDIITKFGGTDITSFSDLTKAKRNYKSGDKVTVQYYRDGKYHDTTLTLDGTQIEIKTSTDSNSGSQTPQSPWDIYPYYGR